MSNILQTGSNKPESDNSDSKKIVVVISGSGSNLQAFIDAFHVEQSVTHIAAVISNRPGVFGLERASNAGIDNFVIDHQSFPDRETFDQAMASKIEQYDPDLIVLAGFMRILSERFVNQFMGKLLNIHPSLLPKYPGLDTHRKALENKELFHGSSVHFVTRELDGGPVIAQTRLALNHSDKEDTVMQKVQKLEHSLYPEIARWFLDGRLSLENNQISLDNQNLKSPVIFQSSAGQKH